MRQCHQLPAVLVSLFKLFIMSVNVSAAAGATWCRILNDGGILGRAARDSLALAAAEFQRLPVASALPHCPYTIGRVVATSRPQAPESYGKDAKPPTIFSHLHRQSWIIRAPSSIHNHTRPLILKQPTYSSGSPRFGKTVS